MLRSLQLLAVFVSAFQMAGALSLEGRVVWNEVCPGYSELGHSKVILDNGRYAGGIRQDGSFQIPDVEEGSYILSVVAHDYAFDQLRVDVHPEGDALPDIRPYVPGTPHNPPSSVTLRYPIALAPRQKAEYFVEQQSFDALGMLKNPMVLMMVAMGGMVLGMPYLMKNLDPELLKEVNERQARGGLSALLTEPEPEPASSHGSSVKQASGSGKSKSSRGGKRR